MTMPEFFVIGAYKAGTTALYYLLRRHSGIFLHDVIKETNFFAPDIRVAFRIEDQHAYESLFRSATAGQKIGEVCPSYLFSEVAAGLIRREASTAKLIAILRDPADRAFSDFMMHVRDGRRSVTDLRPQIEREVRGRLLPDDSPILAQGLYARQLRRFWSVFPRSSVKVILHSDLKACALHTINEVLDFIGVGKLDSIDAAQIYNVSGVPKSAVIQKIINRARAKRMTLKRVVPGKLRDPLMRLVNKNLEMAQMDPAIRAILVSYYRPEILSLQDEIERDLSSWLRC